MARITLVKAARKAQGACHACRAEIGEGASYKWFALKTGPRSSFRRVYCADCRIPRSHQTNSAHLATLWDALDAGEVAIDEAGTIEEITTALSDAASGARDAGEGYRESAENIEEGFGHPTYQSDELNEKADELESFADDLESWSFSGDEDVDEDDIRENLLAVEYDGQHEVGDDGEPVWESDELKQAFERELAEKIEEARETLLDEAKEEARSALSESPH